MGKYDEAYENYYSKIIQNERGGAVRDSKWGKKRRGNLKLGSSWIVNGKFNSKKAINVFIFQLSATAILLIFILMCKIVVNSTTMDIYKYMKETVSYSIDYRDVLLKVRNFDYSSTYDKVVGYVEGIKDKYFNDSSSIKSVTGDFKQPLSGSVEYHFKDGMNSWAGYKDGIVIDVAEGTAVKTCFEGTVREAGSSKELGNYVIVDHGKGVETEYGNLNSIEVKRGDKVKENSIIGNSGGIGNIDKPHLYFQLMYMGEPKDPETYIGGFTQSV